MMILEKSLKKSGLKLEADKLPKDQRTVKIFQKLISNLRSAEAEMIDRQAETDRQLNQVLRENLELHEENTAMKFELVKFKLQERMSDMDNLTIADKTRMIECASN